MPCRQAARTQIHTQLLPTRSHTHTHTHIHTQKGVQLYTPFRLVSPSCTQRSMPCRRAARTQIHTQLLPTRSHTHTHTHIHTQKGCAIVHTIQVGEPIMYPEINALVDKLHARTQIHTQVLTHTHTHTHSHTHTHTQTHTHKLTHPHTHTPTHTYKRVCNCTHHSGW